MFDCLAWRWRVSAFLRGLTRLPGAISVNEAIEPAETELWDSKLNASEQPIIPQPIRDFISTASRRCFFHYEWTPTGEQRTALAELLPGRDRLRGGGDLCEAAKYHNYVNRGWFGESLGALYAKFGLANDLVDVQRIGGAIADEQLHGRVPIIEMKGRGILSLDRPGTDGSSAVIFVESAGQPIGRVLSHRFEQFLLDWEKICYIEPSPEELVAWLDPATGRLSPDPEKCRPLRRLLCGNELARPRSLHA